MRSPKEDHSPFLEKSKTFCSVWGAFRFTLLFIQDPKQGCACHFPWSPPTSLLTLFSGAGLNAEESPLPQSPPEALLHVTLSEKDSLFPPIISEHRAHPGKHITSQEQPPLSRDGMVAPWIVPVIYCTPHALLRRESVQTATSYGNFWKNL